MRKNLFRDWSKSDFGYALKIIANVVLTTASVVFTLNVSSSYLWQSIILGIVFLIGNFYTEYCSLSFRSDTYIGNALYFAVFCLVVLTFSSSDLWITYAVIVAVSVLFSLFRFPLGEIMWGKNGWRWVKNKKAEGKKILDRSARVPLLVLITSALMLFINYVSEFNKKQTILKEAETQKAAENAGPEGTYRFFEKGVHTFVVDTIIPYVRNGDTFFLFVSKDNHIVRTRTYDEEMLLTKKGDTIRIKCCETGKCDEADKLNIAIIKKYNP